MAAGARGAVRGHATARQRGSGREERAAAEESYTLAHYTLAHGESVREESYTLAHGESVRANLGHPTDVHGGLA